MLNTFIPVVKTEIGASLQRDLLRESSSDKDKEYMREQLSRLDVENPMISKFIRCFSKTTDDRMGAAWCGLMVFRLLESQAEANRMEIEINLR